MCICVYVLSRLENHGCILGGFPKLLKSYELLLLTPPHPQGASHPTAPNYSASEAQEAPSIGLNR
jgi:hypothetical protein